MAHINIDTLKKAIKNGELVDSINDEKWLECIPCIQGKQTRKPFPTKATERHHLPGQMIHMDVNFSKILSFQGNHSTLVVIDDASRYVFIHHQASKAEPQEFLSILVPYLETQTGNKLKIIQKDKGHEFLGTISKLILDKGIQTHDSLAGQSAQNGVVERMNRSIWDKARSCILESKLPEQMFDYAIDYVVYTMNCFKQSFHRSRELKTPYEELFGFQPTNLKHLKFGQLVFVHSNGASNFSSANDVSARSEPHIFIGYPLNEKGYKVFNARMMKHSLAHHVRFLPEMFKDHFPNTFLNLAPRPDRIWSVKRPFVTQPFPNVSLLCHEIEEQMDDSDELAYYTMSSASDNIDSTPETYHQAVTGPDREHWIASIRVEMQAYFDQGILVYVKRSDATNILTTKWVFKIKLDELGEFFYKSRCTVRGFAQIAGVD